MIDATHGPIVKNHIYSQETQTRGKGLHVIDDGTGEGSCVNNRIEILSTDQCTATADAVGCRIGDPRANKTLYNWLTTSCNAPVGVHLNEEGRYVSQDGFTPAPEAIGLQVYARQNVFDCCFTGARRDGMDLVFEDGASENTVHTFTMPNGMTNRASNHTNKVISRDVAGFDVTTPEPPPPGEYLTNTTCRSVEAFITEAGDVTEWRLADANGAERGFNAPLSVGQSFVLDPGDRVRIDYNTAPSWSWKALR